MRHSRRGFTLIELLVYLSLVSSALVVFGGIELSAQRTVAIQQALVDIHQQSATYLGRFRKDVEDARSLELQRDRLEVVRLDGTRVTYTGGERLEADAGGKIRGRSIFTTLKAIEVRRVPLGGVELKATFTSRLGWKDDVKRTYRRVATPRRAP